MSCSLDDKPIDVGGYRTTAEAPVVGRGLFRHARRRYDEAVLRVARLHILKRMGEYLEGDDLEGLPDAVAAARAKAMLRARLLRFRILVAAGSAGLSRPEGPRPDRPVPPKTAFVALDEIAPLPPR